MNKLWIFIGLISLLIGTKAWANKPYYQASYMPGQSLHEYFAERHKNYDKSIIYVFFNSENPCESCPQTIDLIEKIYQSYYAQKYNLFLINYGADEEYNFIETYHLRRPLEVVLVQINDGSAFDYRKLSNLQNQISDPVSFTENFTEEINNFLGNGHF